MSGFGASVAKAQTQGEQLPQLRVTLRAAVPHVEVNHILCVSALH